MWKTYKLTCSITNNIYYGSTKLGLEERKRQHQQASESECKYFIEPSIELMDVFTTERQMKNGKRQLIKDNQCINLLNNL